MGRGVLPRPALMAGGRPYSGDRRLFCGFDANHQFILRNHYSHVLGGTVFDLEGNVLEGQLPKRKERNVAAWAGIHHDELLANWELVSNNKDIFKVDPLR